MSDLDRFHDVATQTQVGTHIDPIAQEDRAYLLIQGSGPARIIELAEGVQVLLGRGKHAAVLLDDVNASREHCRVQRTPSGVELTDLESRNGTWVGGRRIDAHVPKPLAAGDVFVAGGLTVVLAVAPIVPARADASAELEVLELGETIVADPASVAVFRQAQRVAQTLSTVLLQGETGVGKEVLAEHIHRRSPRAKGPLVRVNCAALPENLLESELFGHERGAFTGADRRRKGLFEAAHEGTLFLDEFGEISAATQAKLLRALESKQVLPLGTNDPISVDVRILCATHRDLEAAVKAGTFREDLFYRVSALTLTLPPLRERPLELRLLAERFIQAFSERDRKPRAPLTEAASECLRAYRWPGNIRELRNAIEHAVLMADGSPIERQHLPPRLLAAPLRGKSRVPGLGVREEIEDLERARIEQALADHKGSRTRAAQALGMSRRALIYKLHKHGLG